LGEGRKGGRWGDENPPQTPAGWSWAKRRTGQNKRKKVKEGGELQKNLSQIEQVSVTNQEGKFKKGKSKKKTKTEEEEKITSPRSKDARP